MQDQWYNQGNAIKGPDGALTPRGVAQEGLVPMPDQCIKLPLPGGYITIIDSEDEPLVRSYPWYVCRGPSGIIYVASKRRGESPVLMHRLIMGAREDDLVDHRDGNGLNNRRGNLRLCSPTQNAANRRLSTANTSGFKGVSKTKNGRYRAVIRLNRRQVHLGYFIDAESAATAYDEAARSAFGDFACLNFPREGEEGARGGGLFWFEIARTGGAS